MWPEEGRGAMEQGQSSRSREGKWHKLACVEERRGGGEEEARAAGGDSCAQRARLWEGASSQGGLDGGTWRLNNGAKETEVRQVDSSRSILLSQDCFGYSRFFVVPYKL